MWEALTRLFEELGVFLPPRFSKALAIALCAVAAAGETLALVHGSELREALLDRIFLALLAVLSVICLAVAVKYIKNGFRAKTLYIFTLALAAIGLLSAREAYLRRSLVYSSVGYYRDSAWQLEKQTDERMALQLHVEATKDEMSALTFEFDLSAECANSAFGAVYPIVAGQYKVSAQEEGEHATRHRQWRIEKFRRPASLIFQLELDHPGKIGLLCVVDHVRKEKA